MIISLKNFVRIRIALLLLLPTSKDVTCHSVVPITLAVTALRFRWDCKGRNLF
jgi:hypothetical protein